jgi:hypothetical protein
MGHGGIGGSRCSPRPHRDLGPAIPPARRPGSGKDQKMNRGWPWAAPQWPLDRSHRLALQRPRPTRWRDGRSLRGSAVAASSALSERLCTPRRRTNHPEPRHDRHRPLRSTGTAELAWHEARVALATGNGKSAELAARVALSNVDSDSFPRDHTLYAISLASILTRLGQLDEAINVTGEVVQELQDLQGSGRAMADLRHTVDLLGHQNYVPATSFATAVRRLLPASL